MSLTSELLNGGDTFVLTPKDFVQYPMKEVIVTRVVLNRGDWMYDGRMSVTFELMYRGAARRHRYPTTSHTMGVTGFDAEKFLKERRLDFSVRTSQRGPLKFIGVKLKPNTKLDVWLDSVVAEGRLVVESRLGRLPARGPVPAKSVDYAAKKLARRMASCGVSKQALKVGMAVEREHADVTRRGVEKTARIALAHLCERKDYYQRLKKYVEGGRGLGALDSYGLLRFTPDDFETADVLWRSPRNDGTGLVDQEWVHFVGAVMAPVPKNGDSGPAVPQVAVEWRRGLWGSIHNTSFYVVFSDFWNRGRQSHTHFTDTPGVDFGLGGEIWVDLLLTDKAKQEVLVWMDQMKERGELAGLRRSR